MSITTSTKSFREMTRRQAIDTCLILEEQRDKALGLLAEKAAEIANLNETIGAMSEDYEVALIDRNAALVEVERLSGLWYNYHAAQCGYRYQRDALRARLAKVEALHRDDGDGWCAECHNEWLCDTAAALAEGGVVHADGAALLAHLDKLDGD